jgi:hypothetical protein
VPTPRLFRGRKFYAQRNRTKIHDVAPGPIREKALLRRLQSLLHSEQRNQLGQSQRRRLPRLVQNQNEPIRSEPEREMIFL